LDRTTTRRGRRSTRSTSVPHCLARERSCTAEAAIIGQQLDLVLARADVPIKASCACRLEVADT
jgi:hypothetical protein